MKETKEKYLNFNGIATEVPNDMPWGDTQWSSMNGTKWQEDGFGGTNWQDANLNASGEYNPDVPITNLAGEVGWGDPNATRGGRWTANSENRPVTPNDLNRASQGEYNPDVPITNRTQSFVNGDVDPVDFRHWTGDSDISKTRGVPSLGSTDYGPRGQRQNFQETITLDHHQNLRPNMDLVLGDNDNSTMPDSDIWSNHPGFLGGTWWKDFWFPGKAEKERAAAARESIDGKYPISGSCDVLTASEASINAAIANHGKATKRGPKRVAKRNIPILNSKLKTVSSNRQVQCDSEAQDQIQDDKLDMFMQQQMQQPEAKEGMSATNIILGLVIIGGLVWGISRLAKPGAPVAAPAVAPRPAAPIQ